MDTPLPGSLPTVSTCPAHAGMVSRDRFDEQLDELERRLYKAIGHNRTDLEAERRRIDIVIGPHDNNGKLSALTKTVAGLVKINEAKRSAIVKAALAVLTVSAGGTGGAYAIARAYFGGL